MTDEELRALKKGDVVWGLPSLVDIAGKDVLQSTRWTLLSNPNDKSLVRYVLQRLGGSQILRERSLKHHYFVSYKSAVQRWLENAEKDVAYVRTILERKEKDIIAFRKLVEFHIANGPPGKKKEK